MVLATQNPVDLDYKGLANIGHLAGGQAPDRAGPRAAARRACWARAWRRGGREAARRHRASASSCSTTSTGQGPCLLHSRWAMSYLRGPLTREEIARLMKGRGRGASRARPRRRPPRPPARRSCPRPLGTAYLSQYGGELAGPLPARQVRGRYKGAGEAVGAARLAAAAGHWRRILEAEALDVRGGRISGGAPAGRALRRAARLVGPGRRQGLEKALKDRLPDKLAATVWFDPVTTGRPRPGETARPSPPGCWRGARAPRPRSCARSSRRSGATWRARSRTCGPQAREVAGRGAPPSCRTSGSSPGGSGRSRARVPDRLARTAWRTTPRRASRP